LKLDSSAYRTQDILCVSLGFMTAQRRTEGGERRTEGGGRRAEAMAMRLLCGLVTTVCVFYTPFYGALRHRCAVLLVRSPCESVGGIRHEGPADDRPGSVCPHRAGQGGRSEGRREDAGHSRRPHLGRVAGCP